MTSLSLPPRIPIDPPQVDIDNAIFLFIHHASLAVAYFEATSPDDAPDIRSRTSIHHSDDALLTRAIHGFADILDYLYRDTETT